MFSEVDELIKQLEYCILVKKEKAAKEIVRSLARFKVKLTFNVEVFYECSSHYSTLNKHLRIPYKFKKDSLYKFDECKHHVCKECLKDYITKTYRISKADFPFYCPGCLVSSIGKLTLLDHDAQYFREVINKSEFDRSLEEIKILNQNRLTQLKEGLSAKCAFDEIPGIDHTELNYIPNCFHVFCSNCLKPRFINAAIQNSELTCPREGCGSKVDHQFIATLFGQVTEGNSHLLTHSGPENFDQIAEEEFYLLTKLRLEYYNFVKCPNPDPRCYHKQKIYKLVPLAKCDKCGFGICVHCGKQEHTESKCSEINEEGLLLNNQERSNIHRIYICEPESKSPELSRYYYHALSLYEWKLVHENRAFMIKTNSTLPTDISFQIDRVEYINNLMLLLKYEKARAGLREKNCLEPDEIYVYHGTRDANIYSICRDGFRIGGVDVSANHGALYGLGIYTAGDPVVAMSYTLGSKNIIVSRALIGRRSDGPASQDDSSILKEFDYYRAEGIVGLKSDSLYYIFFKSEFLLPIYIIHFK